MSMIDKLQKYSLIQNIAYLIPFSPYRGIVWYFLDKKARSILDVGCGPGRIGRLLNLHKHGAFKVGVDLFKPYITDCSQNGIYGAILLADARSLPFKKKSFDVAVCIEVIEHLEKSDALEVISGLEEIARKQVIISITNTPETFHKSVNSLIPGPTLEENQPPTHKSLWKPDEFRNLGYKVRGMYPNAHFLARYFGFDVIRYLSYILPFPLVTLAYLNPNRARAFICVKNLK